MTTWQMADMRSGPAIGSGAPRQKLPPWVTGLIILCCAIQGVVTVSRFFGFSEMVGYVLAYGAFWTELLDSWSVPLYPGQSVLMFLTYGVLHGGLFHLVMNMVSLAVVARELVRLIGSKATALIHLVSQIVAAAAYAAVVRNEMPMVGASGAIFGLAGALIVMAAVKRKQRGQPMGPLWRATGYIVLLNLALTFLVPNIAWVAHLGGAATGVVMALILALMARRYA